jgi:hypothetical protein
MAIATIVHVQGVTKITELKVGATLIPNGNQSGPWVEVFYSKISYSFNVALKEHGEKYGWDDFTNSALPNKSIKRGDTDTVLAEISPEEL